MVRWNKRYCPNGKCDRIRVVDDVTMIVCDFCGDTDTVYEKDGMHLCKEHDEERRRGDYEQYKKKYGSDPDDHRLIRGLFPCKFCDDLTNCECHHCSKHCLKRLDDLKDKDLFLFRRREK